MKTEKENKSYKGKLTIKKFLEMNFKEKDLDDELSAALLITVNKDGEGGRAARTASLKGDFALIQAIDGVKLDIAKNLAGSMSEMIGALK